MPLERKNKLIPGEALIYERADGVVYARYRDPPHDTIPRWIVGGEPGAISKAQGTIFGYDEWREMQICADKNPALKKQLDRLVIMYYTIKDSIE